MLLVISIFLISLPTFTQCFFQIPQLDKVEERPISSDPGDALFVTPYLETKEKIAEVKERAKVAALAGKVKSYAGYLTVSPKHNSNLFFWFFPSERRPSDDPVLLWLHGGPGHTSMFALFQENGPYVLVGKDQVGLRNNTSWTKQFNVLYIDNPVGAGYSFTDDTDGYSRTVQQAADNLYEALTQFFTLFFEYKKNKFVLTGQSYAGKYIPVLAKLIHEKNKQNATKVVINLNGLFIGCGYINPAKQIRYADFLYESGIIDAADRHSVQCRENSVREASEKNRYYVASYHLAIIAAKMALAGYRPPLDVEQPTINLDSYDQLVQFLQKGDTRAAIHVGGHKFQSNVKVVWYFRADFYNSVSKELSDALRNNYRVLLYVGQFDMIIPPTQMDQVIAHLSWEKLKDFQESERKTWYVNDELAGYKKEFSNFQHILVRRSHHLIVGSQQVWLFDLIKQFCSKI